MASESSFLVDVYFEHSIEHASVFVSSAYPISVRDLIEVLPVKPYVLPHVLIEKQPSSTSLLTIKHALQEHGIPVSVQYRFIQDKAWGEPATLNLDDDTTLEEAWDAEDPVYRKAGKVRLVLQTTAGRVSEIHVGSRMMSGLPSEIVSWRHYISVLRCLVVKLDLSLGGGRWRELSEVIRELQESKSLSEQKMRKMLQDWERLVDHFDPVDINPRDKEENEASEQDFEGQFEQWNRQTQRILIKAVNEYRRKHDTSYKVTDLESRRAPALIQSEYMVPATLNEDRRNESQQTEFRGLKSNLESELLPIFDGKEKTIGHSLPNDIDPIDKESDGFVISSGILLWGQLPTVLAGSLDQGFQGNAESVPEMLPGGTIMRYPLKYRSAARVGNWKVRKAFSQPHNSAGGPTRHFGWVLYHEDVDPVETLERCSRVTGTGGISNGNQHVDKVIRKVIRADNCLPLSASIPRVCPFHRLYSFFSALNSSYLSYIPKSSIILPRC